MRRPFQGHAVLALAAAALFGASAPFAKVLLGAVAPLMLGGLLYLGSGLGLLIVHIGRRLVSNRGDVAEPPLARSDYPWLAGAVLVGGCVAPVLLLWGLSGTAASDAALLLNLEGVLTALVAAMLFAEAVSGRVWAATALMVGAAFALTRQSPAGLDYSTHAAAIVGACGCWALDNNLTRRVSAADPVTLATVKGLAAGACNLALAVAIGTAVPPAVTLAGALVLGFFSYGVSLVLFILALRHLGAARTAAYFGTAPFLGAAIAILVLHEPITASFGCALALMLAATWLVLTEQHAHEHAHGHLAHSHRHVRDEHHQHVHRGDEGPEPHAHWHEHPPLIHSHFHLPDLHHRHGH